MAVPIPCSECAAILEDLRAAAGLPTRDQVLASREITLKAILSTNDEGLDEILRKYAFRLPPEGLSAGRKYSPSKLDAAYRRLSAHRARTGHFPTLFR
jgi:hypothetical protein